MYAPAPEWLARRRGLHAREPTDDGHGAPLAGDAMTTAELRNVPTQHPWTMANAITIGRGVSS